MDDISDFDKSGCFCVNRDGDGLSLLPLSLVYLVDDGDL